MDEGLNSIPFAVVVSIESPSTIGGDSVGEAVGFPGSTDGRGVVGVELGIPLGAEEGCDVGLEVGAREGT